MPALADTPEEAPANQEPVDLQAPEDSTAAKRQRLDPVVESDLSGEEDRDSQGTPARDQSLLQPSDSSSDSPPPVTRLRNGGIHRYSTIHIEGELIKNRKHLDP
ncbi:UNVERIFIED_CONTAM: hypothetical protein K2H54_035791 [Gekko kuhli]